MRRFLLTLTAGAASLGALALFAVPATAQGWYHRQYHDDLQHREFHRYLDHRNAHRYPMTHWQHDRLHDHLDHQRFHDHLEHRQFHRQYYSPYGHSSHGSYYVPSHGIGHSYRTPYYSYPRGSGFGIQGRGFSLFFGR